VSGSLLRRFVAALALVVGFGVATGTAAASAGPVSTGSSISTSTIQSSDYWW
jgi:hypothetical protein